MRRLLLLILIFLPVKFYAIFSSFQCNDTIFLKNKIIVGKITDFDNKKITIINQQNKTLTLPLYRVKSVSFNCFSLTKKLKKDTIVTETQEKIGYILYFNPFSSTILFVDYNDKKIISLPFYTINNDKLLDQKIKFYRYNTINSLILLLFSALGIGLKFLLNLNVYLIASAILAIMGIIGCYIFCRPLLKRKKYLKTKK